MHVSGALFRLSLLSLAVAHAFGPLASSDQSHNGILQKPAEVAPSDDLRLKLMGVDARARTEVVGQLNHATTISTINVILNTVRPDESIPWQHRVPRVLWEICIGMIARSTASSLAAHGRASSLGLLAFLTGATALVDLFAWAPIFALAAKFETCRGGWFTGHPYVCEKDISKGLGRLVVVVQCFICGIVYLRTSMVTWNYESLQREREKLHHRVLSQLELQ